MHRRILRSELAKVRAVLLDALTGVIALESLLDAGHEGAKTRDQNAGCRIIQLKDFLDKLPLEIGDE